MFIVLGIIILGVLLGQFIKSPKAPTLFSKALNVIIYILLLVMGISVGGNEQIVSNLSTIGLKALIITAGAMLGSCICAMLIFKKFFNQAGGDEK